MAAAASAEKIVAAANKTGDRAAKETVGEAEKLVGSEATARSVDMVVSILVLC